MLSGRDLWHTVTIDQAGVPELKVTDGPNGARGADGNHGPTSTSWPTGSAMGATWDPDLIEEMGRQLALEALAKSSHVLLGPTVNIPRIPNAGRNFECFSEDPLLSGLMAAAWIRGVQSQRVSACIKHFVCNDQEQDRMEVSAIIDDRALREIYLEPFRIAIAQAGPWAAMSAYNAVNLVPASEHPMLEEVLRGEFGFDGLVMSDWFGTYGPGALAGGLDLEMPGPARWFAPEVVREALAAGRVDESDIDRKVGHLLTLIERTDAANRRGTEERAEEPPGRRALARRIATDALVLLKNDGLLPLERPSRLAVIGELAADTPHQGGGSSSVNAHRVVSILDGIRQALGPDTEVTWVAGCAVRRTPPALDPASLGPAGLLVEYFDGDAPTGRPVRAETSTRSYLGFLGDHDRGLSLDRFAVRVSGLYTANVAGRHEFRFAAEGRLRVRLGGKLVVDAWDGAAADGHVATAELEKGHELAVTVEFASTPGPRWRFLSLGCTTPGAEPSIEGAVAAARESDVAIVVAGLTPEWESEGFDRLDLRLPGDQDELVAAVAAAQPRTAVVVTSGAPVLMPWVDQVGAVIQAWYGGQEIGHAVADALVGNADPGGRLPVTFPSHSHQHPGLLNYPGEAGRVLYGEGVYVGYRGFDRMGIDPAFPFGHGLSYSTFDVDMVRHQTTASSVCLDLELVNTSSRPGSEVVHVFAQAIGGIDRRLVGFRKVALEGGTSTAVRIDLPVDRFRWWDSARGGWRVHEGDLALRVQGSFGGFDVTVPGFPIARPAEP